MAKEKQYIKPKQECFIAPRYPERKGAPEVAKAWKANEKLIDATENLKKAAFWADEPKLMERSDPDAKLRQLDDLTKAQKAYDKAIKEADKANKALSNRVDKIREETKKPANKK
ncbi:MAG: hypothetical protein PHE49_08400 [bacterium]|nr:hypothetical protein [bacterium]